MKIYIIETLKAIAETCIIIIQIKLKGNVEIKDSGKLTKADIPKGLTHIKDQMKNVTEEKNKLPKIKDESIKNIYEKLNKIINVLSNKSDNLTKDDKLLSEVNKFTSKENKIKYINIFKAVSKKLDRKLNINSMVFPFLYLGGKKLEDMTDYELNTKGNEIITKIKKQSKNI